MCTPSNMSRLEKRYFWLRCSMLLLCGTLFVSGFVLLGLGSWIRYGAASFVDVLGPFSAQFVNISYICIAMGSVLSVTSIIGCCGAFKENRFVIMLFFFIVTVLFIAQLVGVIFVLVYRDLLRIMVYKASLKSLQTSYMGPAATDHISSAWNIVMIKFKCCGFENTTLDFVDSTFTKETGLDYPKTCCVIKTAADCDGTTIADGLIQPEGCFWKVTEVIRDQSSILGLTALGICILQFASMTLAMALFMKIRINRFTLGREKVIMRT